MKSLKALGHAVDDADLPLMGSHVNDFTQQINFGKSPLLAEVLEEMRHLDDVLNRPEETLEFIEKFGNFAYELKTKKYVIEHGSGLSNVDKIFLRISALSYYGY